MPVTILKYLALTVAGVATGQLISDTVSTQGQPPYFHAPTSALTPFMLLSAAILIIAIAYAVRSLVLSVKTCSSERSNTQDYYQ